MQIKKIFICACLCFITHLNLKAESWGCSAVYPTDIYCPEGESCEFYSPSCTIEVGAIGGSSIVEAKYKMDIPEQNFKRITISEGQKLVENYPDLGQAKAYILTATKDDYKNIPFKIVVQTERPSQEFINKIENDIQYLKDADRKQKAHNLVNALKDVKNKNEGIQAIYRSVHSLGEQAYKLYYVRVPGKEAEYGYIIARPDGHLEIHEKNTTDPKVDENITVIDTGDLSLS